MGNDMENKKLQINGVTFKRTKNSKWEHGIMINEDKLIIDMDGNPVTKQVENHVPEPYKLSVIYIPEA